MKLILFLIATAASTASTASVSARHLHRAPAEVIEPSRATVPIYRPPRPGFRIGQRTQ